MTDDEIRAKLATVAKASSKNEIDEAVIDIAALFLSNHQRIADALETLAGCIAHPNDQFAKSRFNVSAG